MKDKNKPSKNFFAIPIIIAIISALSYGFLNYGPLSINHVPYIEFLNKMNSEEIKKVYLSTDSKINFETNDNKKYATDNPRSESFKEMLLTRGIDVEEVTSKPISHSLPLFLFLVSLISLLVILIKNSSIGKKGMLSPGNLDLEAVESIDITFDKVAGNEEAKESVKDIVDFLKNPEKYAKYGARMPKGIIFYGDPGTGKTLLAKAVAGEANVPFYAVSGSDFVQMYVGVGASRIRNLFKKAREKGTAVIFIDEIDAIGKSRDNGKNGGTNDEKDQTLNALLTEMSGFNESEGIVVIAATNRLDMLDSALLRPGRFDRHIEISLPDVSAREKILDLHMQNKPFQSIDLKDWALKTAYFSGAKIESLVNEAAILACKDECEHITTTQLDKAFSIVVAGHEKINRDHIKDIDREVTAYHEIGHALISLKALPEEKVAKITIIPSTKGAGGYTLSIPDDTMHQTKTYLKNKIKVLLAGRAAEEIIFDKDNITTGAFNDLQRVTRLAANMISQYGMNDGNSLLNLHELQEMGFHSSKEIIKECDILVNSLYEETKAILLDNKVILEAMAQELLEKETLNEEDLIKYI